MRAPPRGACSRGRCATPRRQAMRSGNRDALENDRAVQRVVELVRLQDARGRQDVDGLGDGTGVDGAVRIGARRGTDAEPEVERGRREATRMIAAEAVLPG